MSKPHPLLRFFAYAHLPPQLQEASKPFADAAEHVASLDPWDKTQQTRSLEKLLEAKDCAVRAMLRP